MQPNKENIIKATNRCRNARGVLLVDSEVMQKISG